jgi:hypothetical protein
MVFKLALSAQKKWRALNGSQLIGHVIEGVHFVDGIRKPLSARICGERFRGEGLRGER